MSPIESAAAASSWRSPALRASGHDPLLSSSHPPFCRVMSARSVPAASPLEMRPPHRSSRTARVLPRLRMPSHTSSTFSRRCVHPACAGARRARSGPGRSTRCGRRTSPRSTERRRASPVPSAGSGERPTAPSSIRGRSGDPARSSRPSADSAASRPVGRRSPYPRLRFRLERMRRSRASATASRRSTSAAPAPRASRSDAKTCERGRSSTATLQPRSPTFSVRTACPRGPNERGGSAITSNVRTMGPSRRRASRRRWPGRRPPDAARHASDLAPPSGARRSAPRRDGPRRVRRHAGRVRPPGACRSP